ncbi:cytosolic Fe-S cluster assembly factor NBP35-like protein [Cinnamomum micranthum f. kanehirae]|uniref:Cytosolic Fe-S cluster assembly factor NBP35-like protein n=1 Tax=Cinnamomum micranthum f. kanehirae TaxID=337451 RepID=A0A3S3PA75_9MAGN|nr:cytosolic Fe-S cluster assembly factor NBP35-like protein [Cinnamomum micranthum f. kanehirae]
MRKEISFCKKVGIPVLGVVENIIGLRQSIVDFGFMKMTLDGDENDAIEWAVNYIKAYAPGLLSLVACSEVFDSGGGRAKKMCMDMQVPFLDKVRMDPQLCKAAEEGHSYFADQKCSPSAPALRRIIDKLFSTLPFQEPQ